MKPAQERNQESLPPKKRDLLVSASSVAGGAAAGGVGGAVGGGSGGVGGGSGGDEVSSCQSTAASSDCQGGVTSGEWLRAQPGPHYGVEGADGIPAVPVDQYSMLYKVAVPSGTYSPTTLHPVLSHISPAYTVHSPLLQHPGIPYPPLGYAQIPHSSLQLVSSPYAVPYALPTGFVPSSLISPSGTIPQPHTVPHLVPYPSVIQEGVVSPPPQAQVTAHAFAKVTAPSGVPLMLSSEQTAQQHLSTVGVLPTAELSPRGMPVYYQPQAARAASNSREAHGTQQENDAELNGGDREQASREVFLDSVYTTRNARLLQPAPSSAALEHAQDRNLRSRRLEERSSPGHRSTPDSDLEVQQVVGRLAPPVQGGGVGRKEVSFAPLNLSHVSQRGREAHGENMGGISGRTAYTAQPVAYGDPRLTSLQQETGPPGHAVMLANGQPVLIPLEYHSQQQSQTQPPQEHYAGQANDSSSCSTVASLVPNVKVSDPPARVCLPDRAVVELATAQQQHAVPVTAALTQALAPTLASPPTSCNPSHFMKGAIIQLATGELKRVEDLQTQDFVRSAEVSGGLKIDSSMVVDIRASQQRSGLVALHFTVGEQQSKVTIDVPPEHPFFVFGQGWSSCSPERTAQLYGLSCHHLQVGDVCVSVTLQQQLQQKQPQQQQHLPQQQSQATTSTKANSTSGPSHQPMGPPAPHQPRPPPHFRIERVPREREREREKEGDKEEAVQVGVVGQTEFPTRPNRTSAEHTRSQSSYYLHTEGSTCLGAPAMQPMVVASQRRWSAPGLQRYAMKGDEGPRSKMAASGPTRPSFIPQEVKLSIEGRSNAGK
ncbi:ataxin-1-like [Lampris incognitus]|uniref:ataxin-1-like n=1 Tax=Lampris incognitus TaxID=2546036 RepID=UPI0024B48248|nr:ataxin-1-like [Lampris incognitus]